VFPTRPLLLAVALCAAQAQAADTVPTEQAKKNGFVTCGAQLDKVAQHLLSENEHGALSTWNKITPDKRMFNSQIVANYSDGHSAAVISTAQSPAGGCDSSYTTVFHWEQSCSSMRETTFKDWKYFGEVGSLSVLENESGAINKILMPAGKNGCVTISTEVLYD
jgi:hypothetical protein